MGSLGSWLRSIVAAKKATTPAGPPKLAVAYVAPSAGGGSQLDIAPGTNGLGEPLNVIISGLSNPAVLTDAGLLNFAKAIGFTSEFLGIHLGAPQTANLGDGNGNVNETMELRADYGNAIIGSGIETLVGGNHFRMYRQNGPKANSGALFLAVSWEEPVTKGHNIIPDGYNIGRDQLVARAVNTNPKPSFNKITYLVTVENITGLIPPGSVGVNHGIATDGIVKLLTVNIA